MGTTFPRNAKSGIEFTQYCEKKNPSELSDATERWEDAIEVN